MDVVEAFEALTTGDPVLCVKAIVQEECDRHGLTCDVNDEELEYVCTRIRGDSVEVRFYIHKRDFFRPDCDIGSLVNASLAREIRDCLRLDREVPF